jgi:hypothetical protein
MTRSKPSGSEQRRCAARAIRCSQKINPQARRPKKETCDRLRRAPRGRNQVVSRCNTRLAKAPPHKTVAFHAIVDSNRAPEDAELADTLDEIAKGGRRVTAVTIPLLVAAATGDFLSWLLDRKNRRVIPYRLESAGYVPSDRRKCGLPLRDRRLISRCELNHLPLTADFPEPVLSGVVPSVLRAAAGRATTGAGTGLDRSSRRLLKQEPADEQQGESLPLSRWRRAWCLRRSG